MKSIAIKIINNHKNTLLLLYYKMDCFTLQLDRKLEDIDKLILSLTQKTDAPSALGNGKIIIFCGLTFLSVFHFHRVHF